MRDSYSINLVFLSPRGLLFSIIWQLIKKIQSRLAMFTNTDARNPFSFKFTNHKTKDLLVSAIKRSLVDVSANIAINHWLEIEK